MTMNLPTRLEDQKVILKAVKNGHALTVRHEGDNRVLVLKDGQPMFDGTPEAAIALAEETKERCNIARRENAPSVLMFGTEVPPGVATLLSNTMIAKANLAIETRPKVAERLAVDGAILLRAGVPLGLTNHPKILAMTKTEAESNRDLRRHMSGIKSEVQFGTPAIKSPTPLEAIADSLARLTELTKE